MQASQIANLYSDEHTRSSDQPFRLWKCDGSKADLPTVSFESMLYLKTKNFHWHISGPHFHDYHHHDGRPG